MTAAFLVTPPLLFAVVRHRLIAVVCSVAALWILLIIGGQYHLSFTPDYGSLAPGLAVIVGWLPSTVYTLIWLGGLALLGNNRPGENERLKG